MSMRVQVPPKSLQARLLALLLSLVAVVWLAAAALTWVDARHELDELLDGHLAQAAALLVVQQTRTGGEDEDDAADAPVLHKYAPRVAFQVFHEGQLMMRSANAGVQPMSTQSRGFLTVQLADGKQWRVFGTRGGESDVQVYVGEQMQTRSEILWAVLRGMLLPLVLALPVLALLLWWAVRQGLEPLRQLSQALGQRQPQALQPVVLAHVPSEIAPLVQALNALFGRIDAMVASERRFTADAAHELRTPIAAIRAQAQVALGAGSDTAQRDNALQFTLAGCERATRLVDQLLTLSRLEASAAQGSAALPASLPLDLSALVRRVAADVAPAALARQQTLELDAPQACVVQGDETLLAVLVRNLLDNAVRYSPHHARIAVQVAAQNGHTLLQVQDSGAGMSAAEIARLGERFYRVLGQEQPGSGLGWSIVQKIAVASGAQLEVARSASLGGLAVRVLWVNPASQNPVD
jgi:two-component system, OmpR family, sensor histidine kinase QseC